MKKLLFLMPLFVLMVACTFSVSTVPAPTEISQYDPSQIPPEATFTFTPEPSSTLNATITGKLSYPSEFIPAMRVVAFSLTDGKAYFVDTAMNQGTYSLAVPGGTYYVVSYVYEGNAGQTDVADSFTLGGGPFSGGFTQMVPCGLASDCDDHTLIPIIVEAGQMVTVDPGDWYAPEGTFPQMPMP